MLTMSPAKELIERTLAKNRDRQSCPVPSAPLNTHRIWRHLSNVSLPPFLFQFNPAVLPPATVVRQARGVIATRDP